MSKKRNQRTNRADYQSLEDRRLLAVSVTSNAGTVNIIGDGAANTVQVEQVDLYLRVTTESSSHQFEFSSVSAVRFFGGSGDDSFTNLTDINTVASGQDGNDQIVSGNGDDSLFGGTGNDTLTTSGGVNTLGGGAGDDTLNGGSGNDRLDGSDGADRLFGNAGDDVLTLGIGDDFAEAGDGDDIVFAFLGDDEFFGGEGNDFLYGQFGSNTGEGGAGNDVLSGGEGNDVFRGDAGNDRLLGVDGADELFGGAGLDTIFGGVGNDLIHGGAGSDRLFAGSGNDTVFGEQGNDVIRGNDGMDQLFGGDQADRIAGDSGHDHIEGGAANDNLFGGDGNDTFVGTTSDRVTGEAGDDVIQLSVSQTNDVVNFSSNYSNYVVTQDGDTLIVNDTTGGDGLDRIIGADSLQFTDQIRTAAAEVTERVYIQPIVVSNSDGSNTAEFFGNSDQAFEIRRLIDEIYLQAGIDVEWLTENTINNTFYNVGDQATRPQNDLSTIVNGGDAAGVGSSDPLILDMYFVEVVPGFGNTSENVANGLAFVGGNGIAMQTGDNLVGFQNGRQVVAEVAAHEIAHNLGLTHVHDENNLMDGGTEINASQATTIINSSFTQTI